MIKKALRVYSNKNDREVTNTKDKEIQSLLTSKKTALTVAELDNTLNISPIIYDAIHSYKMNCLSLSTSFLWVRFSFSFKSYKCFACMRYT